MGTHLFVCGHGYNDPGAVGNGTTEREFTRNVFRAAVIKYANQLKKNKIVWYDVSKDLFQDTASGWGLYGMTSKSYDSVTEWHLDAASPQATGGHVIINSSFKADGIDLQCGKAIKDVVGWWGSVASKQGVNGRNNLLNCNVAAQRGINYRLIELGFITSNRDMTNIKRDIDKYAKLFVEAITGEKITGGVDKPVEITNNRTKHIIFTGRVKNNSAAYKKIEKYLKDNKWSYTKINKDGQTRFKTGRFNQNSASKFKLEKWLAKNNLSYTVELYKK